MLTITRKDLLLTINDNVIPAMGSSDVPVKFVNDEETYQGFLIEPRVGYYVNGCPKSIVCEYSNDTIKIPAEAFKNKGILVIAIALIDNEDSNHIEVTKELALEVTPAPNGTVILPATETWQTAVKNLVEQLYNQDYKPQFDQIEEDLSSLVEEAENQQSKAKEQQTQIDNAIDIMGDYEIVQDNPTQIRFKKGDGTYGDTVNLGDNLASKSMVNAGYDTYSGNSYSGSASDYGIEIGKASGAYEQEGTPTPERPVEPKFFDPKYVNTNGGNLFDASKIQTTTQGGATVTNNGDGSFTVSGSGDLSENFSVSYNYTHEETVNMLKAGTIRLGGDIPSTLPRISFFINTSSGNKNVLSNNAPVGEKSSNILQETLDDPSARLYIGLYGSANATIQAGTVKPMVYQDGDGTWYPFNADSTPLGITLRALPNGVCDTYENRVITRRVGIYIVDTIGSLQTLTPSGRKFFALNTGNKKHQDGMISFLCNKIQKTEAGTQDDCIYQNPLNFVIVGTADDTLDTFKEKFLNTIVYYELAEPTIEKVDLPIIPSYFPYTNAWHDSDVEASDLTWHVLTAVNGKSSIRDGLGALLKDASMTPNDNLLINSDFRSGVINQKGITSLDKSDGSTELGIDGWIQYGINIAVGTNYITFANRTSANHTVQQPLDIKGLKAGDKVTFYASCFNITGNVYIYMTGLDAQKKKLINGDNEFTFTLTSALERFYIELAPNAVVSFNCKKLEIGEHFTGMPLWNRASELEKCKERFLFVPVIFNGYVDENGKIFIACEDSRKLVKEPSLIIDANTQIVLYYDDGNGTYLLENIKEGRYATKDGYICLGTLTSYKNWRISGYYKSGKIFLDTYDYD